MALIVEDGTGKEDANAFVYGLVAPTGTPAWVLSAVRYWVDRGRGTVRNPGGDVLPRSQWAATSTLRVGSTDYSNDQINAAIVRATFYLSESFAWKGYRRYGRQSSVGGVERFQALAWPRHDVVDNEGRYVDEDSFPREIGWATAEASFYELANPNALQPIYESNRRISQVRAGSASVSFDTSRINASGARPRMLVIMDLIGEFLAAGAGNAMVGTAVRG